MEKTSILANLGNDIQSRLDWLESTLTEATNQGDNLWASPYAGLLKLSSLSQCFIENIEKYMPENGARALSFQRNQIISDLARIESHAKRNNDMASYWLATLFGCLLTLEDMLRNDEDCHVVSALHKRSLDLLCKAQTLAA